MAFAPRSQLAQSTVLHNIDTISRNGSDTVKRRFPRESWGYGRFLRSIITLIDETIAQSLLYKITLADNSSRKQRGRTFFARVRSYADLSVVLCSYLCKFFERVQKYFMLMAFYHSQKGYRDPTQ